MTGADPCRDCGQRPGGIHGLCDRCASDRVARVRDSAGDGGDEDEEGEVEDGDEGQQTLEEFC